jgi:hypothetical protein
MVGAKRKIKRNERVGEAITRESERVEKEEIQRRGGLARETSPHDDTSGIAARKVLIEEPRLQGIHPGRSSETGRRPERAMSVEIPDYQSGDSRVERGV